jgi:signal transduction histidine kinase
MTERRVQVGAVAVGIVGLLMVWHLVNVLWAQGWSMNIIHAVAILAAALVTLAASVTVVAVVIRYRRILERKNQELQRLAAIGETVAGLVHYQKNLLNGLRGGLYIADGAMEKGDAGKLRDGWRMLDDIALRIERLTMDMLYYVKERTPRREPTDLSQLIEEVIDLMRNAAAACEVELRAELDEAMDQQLLDRTAVYRSLLNLVDNAIDACAEAEPGGLVTLKSRATAGEIVVTVTDDGIGMTDEVLSNLFVRFFSTKGGQGTGLGLVVAKEVVEEHGGSLEVESEPGQGSSFHLHFPTAPAPSCTRGHLSNTTTEGEKNVGQEANTDRRRPGGSQALPVADS